VLYRGGFHSDVRYFGFRLDSINNRSSLCYYFIQYSELSSRYVGDGFMK
jgi:hypothetical protein